MAARIAIMAITTSNSIRVNIFWDKSPTLIAFVFLNIVEPPFAYKTRENKSFSYYYTYTHHQHQQKYMLFQPNGFISPRFYRKNKIKIDSYSFFDLQAKVLLFIYAYDMKNRNICQVWKATLPQDGTHPRCKKMDPHIHQPDENLFLFLNLLKYAHIVCIEEPSP
jgi:hypothetical protein